MSRLFITGVSPVTMDDVTSGFNIGTNISLRPAFADLTGVYDLSLAPRFDIAPKIAHAALIELKYVKAGDPAPTPEVLEKIKAEAARQLDQYSSDPALIAAWRIKAAILDEEV